MVAQRESSADTVRTFPEISTITNPEFPAKIRTLTAQFETLKAQSINAIAVGRGDGCMSTLKKFGKRLAENLQILDATLKHINSGGMDTSSQFSEEQMSSTDAIDFLSQRHLPQTILCLVSTFGWVKDNVAKLPIGKSPEMKKGVAAYCDLPMTNDFLTRAVETLEEVLKALSPAIPNISAQTSQAAATATDIPSAE